MQCSSDPVHALGLPVLKLSSAWRDMRHPALHPTTHPRPQPPLCRRSTPRWRALTWPWSSAPTTLSTRRLLRCGDEGHPAACRAWLAMRCMQPAMHCPVISFSSFLVKLTCSSTASCRAGPRLGYRGYGAPAAANWAGGWLPCSAASYALFFQRLRWPTQFAWQWGYIPMCAQD